MHEQAHLPVPAAPETSKGPKVPKRPATAAGRRWAIGLQLLALAIVAAVGLWLARNAAINLASRHISSGFGFLKDSAGFAIAEGPLSFDSGDTYARAFTLGFLNTVRAAVPAVIFATVLGFALGIAQISRHPLVRLSSRTVVDLVRNVPLVVQVLFWYFLLTQLLPDGETPLHLGTVLFLSKGGLALPEPSFSTASVLIGVALTVALPWLAHKFARRRPGAMVLACLVVVAAWCVLPQSWQLPEPGTFGVNGGMALSPEWL
ncbi:MAG TPA: ABC transporter permease subunit, partial [Trinickia sp.]|nr:ABC transporter permease subunit [Trinickia sp.]